MAATGTENQAKSQARSTSERILDAAEDLFAEKGYSATSLGDVADRVGIRSPSLYNFVRDSSHNICGYCCRKGTEFTLVPSSCSNCQPNDVTCSVHQRRATTPGKQRNFIGRRHSK